MKTDRLLVVLAIGSLLMSATARCDVLSYEFIGRVNLVFGTPPFYGISPSIGDKVTGSFTFDTLAIDSTEAGGLRTYLQAPPNHFAFTMGGLTMETDISYKMTIIDGSIGDQFAISDYGLIRVNGSVREGNIELHITDRTGNTVRDFSIPAPLDLSNFSFTSGQISAASDVGVFSGAVFSLTSLTEVGRTIIPEPSTWALLALGSAVLWYAARRRNSN